MKAQTTFSDSPLLYLYIKEALVQSTGTILTTVRVGLRMVSQREFLGTTTKKYYRVDGIYAAIPGGF